MKFSVSMCVYEKDNPKHFCEALSSVINQTVKPDEIVIVADGPITSELQNVIDRAQKSENIIKPVYLEKNMGHGNARRIGFQACTNELIALMDSDDISVSDRFEKQLALFENNKDLSIVGGQIYEFIDSVDNVVGKRIVPLCDHEIKQYMRSRCPMNQVTVMFKKSDVEEAGGYIDWYCDEDYYLWLRMSLKNMKFANISDNLVYFRVGNDMYKRRGGFAYFKSEAKLQKYMLDNNIISKTKYISNVSKRFILQVLMPNSIRGFVFRKFAREK